MKDDSLQLDLFEVDTLDSNCVPLLWEAIYQCLKHDANNDGFSRKYIDHFTAKYVHAHYICNYLKLYVARHMISAEVHCVYLQMCAYYTIPENLE